MVDYQSGSPEMQASGHFEVAFRDWLLGYIKTFGYISKSEAVHSGAETVGCSSVASYRYLQKMISGAGVLRETRNDKNVPTIVLK